MGSFLPRSAVWVLACSSVIGAALAGVALGDGPPVEAGRSVAICTIDASLGDAATLPVSKARLLAFGNYRGPSASHKVEAQRFFDQGLVFGWGFNFAEAVRSFRVAAQLDPTCALCRWGSHGPSGRASITTCGRPMCRSHSTQSCRHVALRRPARANAH